MAEIDSKISVQISKDSKFSTSEIMDKLSGLIPAEQLYHLCCHIMF